MGIADIFKGSGLRTPRSARHKGKRVSEILEAHDRYVRGDETGARADFAGAEVSKVDFGRANLAYANFRGANLQGANLREAKLASADCSEARMQKADLRKADLTEANLNGANLAEALIAGAELFRADLRGADLRGADLSASNLRDAQVHGANLAGANLNTTILRETNLEGVDLSGLDLSTTLLPRNHSSARKSTEEAAASASRCGKAGAFVINAPWFEVDDYKEGSGWVGPEQHGQRARAYCELLERGRVLFFREPPFPFPQADREFLLAQEWTDLRMHKNVSYRPTEDALRGISGEAAKIERIHAIFRDYSVQVIEFAKNFLAPYAKRWTLDFASFRPIEEERRGLPLHKRNDLLHVDAFPSRPTRGGRILRVFTNLNPEKPRVWNTTENFEALAHAHAEPAGLRKIAEDDGFVSRTVQDWGAKLGFSGFGRTPYDMFMLRFHDYLKENQEFQANCPKVRMEFPPGSTWMVFTDGVAHAVLSGRFAIEQTFLIPPNALVAPQFAPYKILEQIAGVALVS